MWQRKVYYQFKPYLPWRLRLAVRGALARRKRHRVRDIWPIDPAASVAPAGWPGWPDGKRFALVLTHDVEGAHGLRRCRALAELELQLGLRSSFNFIPEGPYSVHDDLRQWLAAEGFEIGVHDLRHDGKLFSNRRNFERAAGRINHYLREWKAVGYRSGFMLRNLDWFRDLDIRYDASTFDTDPFEPQPDGSGTIFPFRVGDAHRSYIELPYTLPQDSTLFLLLGEDSISVWQQKLEWIARHGGMALVNVHPDYLRLPDEPARGPSYPVSHYIEFLEHIRRHYAGQYWHALPSAVAAHAAMSLPAPTPRKRRVCIVSHSDYSTDARVFRYGSALAERGDDVHVLALASSDDTPREEVVNGVRISRLQVRQRGNTSQGSFLKPLLKFLYRATVRISREHGRQPFDLLHIHNVPDFLVFAALRPKLAGARVILDIHDIVPEFFASKFGVPAGSWKVRLLQLMERASAAFADHVIISNDLWLERYTRRSAPRRKCSVFINNVDTGVFFPRSRNRIDDRLIILFPGGLQWHQGLDIAIRAFAQIRERFPNAEFHIYGEGSAKTELQHLTEELQLTERVKFFAPRPLTQIAEIMANADLGVVPKRADSFGNEAYSTKIMEFMAVGTPVVVSATKIDRFYFNDEVVRFFESGNVNALAEALEEMLRDSALRQSFARRASAYAQTHSWERRKIGYLQLVDTVCG